MHSRRRVAKGRPAPGNQGVSPLDPQQSAPSPPHRSPPQPPGLLESPQFPEPLPKLLPLCVPCFTVCLRDLCPGTARVPVLACSPSTPPLEGFTAPSHRTLLPFLPAQGSTSSHPRRRSRVVCLPCAAFCRHRCPRRTKMPSFTVSSATGCPVGTT